MQSQWTLQAITILVVLGLSTAACGRRGLSDSQLRPINPQFLDISGFYKPADSNGLSAGKPKTLTVELYSTTEVGIPPTADWNMCGASTAFHSEHISINIEKLAQGIMSLQWQKRYESSYEDRKVTTLLQLNGQRRDDNGADLQAVLSNDATSPATKVIVQEMTIKLGQDVKLPAHAYASFGGTKDCPNGASLEIQAMRESALAHNGPDRGDD